MYYKVQRLRKEKLSFTTIGMTLAMITLGHTLRLVLLKCVTCLKSIIPSF